MPGYPEAARAPLQTSLWIWVGRPCSPVSEALNTEPDFLLGPTWICVRAYGGLSWDGQRAPSLAPLSLSSLDCPQD